MAHTAHTKRTRTRKSLESNAGRPAGAESTVAPVGRGARFALVATLALSLATAIASAAWLIGTQEDGVKTANTMPNTQFTASASAADSSTTSAAPTATPTEASTALTTTADNSNVAVAATTRPVPQTTRPSTASTASTAAAASTASPASTAAAAATPATPSTPSAAGQRVFIDPKTGQFREPEHDELAALAAAAAAAAPARRLARTASTAAESFGPDGSVEAIVPEELHTFTVATRGPDGRIVIEHAQGPKNADRLMQANSAKNPRAPVSHTQQKEDRNDR